MEDSRETATLAVHGVPFGWNADKLLKDFPRAMISNYTREGTVFLKYRQSEYAIQDFIRNDNIKILSSPVIVMFSHQRGYLFRGFGKTSSYRNTRESPREVDRSPSYGSDVDRDLRSRINNNQERKWSELIW